MSKCNQLTNLPFKWLKVFLQWTGFVAFYCLFSVPVLTRIIVANCKSLPFCVCLQSSLLDVLCLCGMSGETAGRRRCSGHTTVCTHCDMSKRFLSVGVRARNDSESTLPCWQVRGGESRQSESVVKRSERFGTWSEHHRCHTRSEC